ncbi:DUF998 domain-containing protein [Actinomadura algeriensis]|uniref:Membrane protein n=1 Tax=Actinomadura algeriensis TaxID=1679523 RepID=A0ABR9JNQ4_9ACTN|nr:DUF998 domain-containing protein [Actinomadura algeriensis]MBE1531976.1 putative membrane protein [Actinomadura algeriensis]
MTAVRSGRPIAETIGAPARPGPPLQVAAIAAGPLFLVSGLVQALTRDGFDFSRNALSQLALGDLGWVQTVTFLLTGALLIVGAAGTGRTLRGAPGGRRAPRLIGVFGASFLLAAVFPADAGAGFPAGTPETGAATLSGHGALHLLSGAIGYIALVAAFLVLARTFAARDERGWALATRTVAAAVVAGFAASSVSVPAFTVGAGLGLVWLAVITARLTSASPTGRL